ncbi:hypothetical protein [Azospirillum sp.]|uniref:hypothetical protein n=1 Tax=Azospirillum sp. TaxID=34012 RepID=UPI002D5EA923|nr:hypothetical protein [Azospirillum sp.]HYD66157.1 hypothetical protein [Azospirillum sp.]
MLAWLARSGLLAVLAPLLEVFLKSLGATLNASQAAKRAEQNAQDLGEAKAHVEQGNVTISSQKAQLEAQANAPRSVEDAIRKLEGDGEV